MEQTSGASPAGKPALILAWCLACLLWALPCALPATASAEGGDSLVAVVLKDFPPLYTTDQEGNHVGFAMDVLREVAARAGFSYEVLAVDNWGQAMDAVRSGKADFIPGIGISPAREERFLFSDVFETIPVSCFVRSDAHDIGGIQDLHGHRTAVIDQSAAQTALGRREGIRLIPYNSIEEAFFSLLSGKVDAFVFPQPVLERKASEIGFEDRVKVVGRPLMELRRGYLFRQDDTALRDRVNEALRPFVGSPEFSKIYTRWWRVEEPVWGVGMVAFAAGFLLVAVAVLFAAWRWHTVSALNRRLKRTMEELLQAQARLEDSEKLLKKAQELTSVGSFERDLTTGEGHWSDMLFNCLGHTPGEDAPPLKRFIDQIHPDDRERYIESTRKGTPDRPTNFLEFRFKPLGSNEYRHAMGLYTFEFGPDGTPVKLIGAIQDITERKAIEKQLREAKERAEAASLAKSEFLANVSHELRTPLNGAMGMLQLIDRKQLDSENQDYVRTALVSCRNLTTLINDILDLSKVEANKLVLSMVDFNPIELLASVRETFLRLAGDKDIGLVFAVDDNLPECVVGDPARLRQVLFNLVGNAIKFTDTGAVTLEVASLARTDDGMCRLLFSVGDTGIGVPDDMVERIFGAFTQVDGAYSRKFQGTGLGLHIVKRLVHLMGGHIAIESEENKGTTVHVTLSFLEVKRLRPADRTPFEPVPATVSPRHILIVEDERVNRLTISRFVERLGHTFVCAANGVEALQILQQEDVDLILMDIQMPIMTGIEATRAIRTLDSLGDKRDIPIVALTAHAMSGDREAFLAEGMNGYLAKPISLRELQELLLAFFNDQA